MHWINTASIQKQASYQQGILIFKVFRVYFRLLILCIFIHFFICFFAYMQSIFDVFKKNGVFCRVFPRKQISQFFCDFFRNNHNTLCFSAGAAFSPFPCSFRPRFPSFRGFCPRLSGVSFFHVIGKNTNKTRKSPKIKGFPGFISPSITRFYRFCAICTKTT